MYNLRVLCKLSTNNIPKFCHFNGSLIKGYEKFSTRSKKAEEVIEDGPIKYTKSPAIMYKAKTTRTGVIEPRLWYEPYILIASISVFLLYFTVIREENDIDEELQISLYSRIAGLEEHQLRASLEYNRHHGLETEGIIKRLKEIEKEKNEAVES